MTKRTVSVFMLVAAGVAAGCGSDKADGGLTTTKEEALKPQTVQAASVVLKDRQPVVTTTGTLVPRRRAELRALSEGRLDVVNVDIGARVRAGQTLVQVRTVDYENTLAQAEATVARAQVGLVDREREKRRMEGLFKEGSATEQMRDQAATAFDEAQAGLKEAQAYASRARQALEDCTLRAPYDGVITMRNRQRGEYVARGDVVVEIMDLSVLEAEMEVAEPFAGRIASGLPVDLMLRGGAAPVTAQIVAVNPKVDMATRTFKVKVQVDNKDGALQAGLFCTGVIKLPVEAGRPAIPASALNKDEGRSTVWVIADGKAHARPVVVNGSTDGWVFVDEGLKEGEAVVSGGAGGLFDGAPVNVQSAGGA